MNRICLVFVVLLMVMTQRGWSQQRPNILFVYTDDQAPWALGASGNPQAHTPNMDRLADQGLVLKNFNVEVQCTPSRSAIMTGRYAIRSGNGTVPLGEGVYGLVQWEITMAEMLSDAGYATAFYAKWHLGDTEGRYPTDQGFDEWIGISRSSDRAFWPDSASFTGPVGQGLVGEFLETSPASSKLRLATTSSPQR